MNKNLNNAAIAGVIAAILLIPGAILEFLRSADKLTGNLFPVYVLITIISIISYLYFIWGFKIIADRTKNKLLGISTYLLMIVTVLLYATTFLSQNESDLLVSHLESGY